MPRRKEARNQRGPSSNFYDPNNPYQNQYDDFNYNNFNSYGNLGMTSNSARAYGRMDNIDLYGRAEFNGQRNFRKKHRPYNNRKQQETQNNVNFNYSNQGYNDNSNEVGCDKSNEVGCDKSNEIGCDETNEIGCDESNEIGCNDPNKIGYNSSNEVVYNNSNEVTKVNDNNSIPSCSWTDAFWHKQNTIANQISDSPKQNLKTTYNKVEKTLNKMLAKPAEMSKGKSLLEKMGWKGGGLGKDESGILEPIAPKAAYATQTIGLGSVIEREQIQQIQTPNLYENLLPKKTQRKLARRELQKQRRQKKWTVESEEGMETYFKNPKKKFNVEFQTTILLKILEFVQDDTKTELLFEEQVTKLQRKKVHQLVENLRNIDDPYHFVFELESEIDIVEQILKHNRFNLCTESDGLGVGRRLTLYKDAPEDIFLITPEDLKDDIGKRNSLKNKIENKRKINNALNNRKKTKSKNKKPKLSITIVKNDKSNLVLSVPKENELNNDSNVKQNIDNVITDSDNKDTDDVNKNNETNIDIKLEDEVSSNQVNKNCITVDEMKVDSIEHCNENSKIDKTRVTSVNMDLNINTKGLDEDKIEVFDKTEKDTKNIENCTDNTNECNDNGENSEINEKTNGTESNDIRNTEIYERIEENNDIPEIYNIESENYSDDSQYENYDLTEKDDDVEGDVIKIEENNEIIGEPKENTEVLETIQANNDKIMAKLVAFLEEFVKSKTFKEFRFLGTFDKDEYETIQLFFDVISGKDVECGEKAKILGILKNDSFNIDCKVDTNGSHLIIKSKKNSTSPKTIDLDELV